MTPPTPERPTHHFNGLTPAEQERLSLLMEECAEVIQCIGKILRHGYESYDPTSASVSPTNREALEAELGDVQHAVDRMIVARDVRAIAIRGAAVIKAARVSRWLHHQPDGDSV